MGSINNNHNLTILVNGEDPETMRESIQNVVAGGSLIDIADKFKRLARTLQREKKDSSNAELMNELIKTYTTERAKIQTIALTADTVADVRSRFAKNKEAVAEVIKEVRAKYPSGAEHKNKVEAAVAGYVNTSFRFYKVSTASFPRLVNVDRYSNDILHRLLVVRLMYSKCAVRVFDDEGSVDGLAKACRGDLDTVEALQIALCAEFEAVVGSFK